MTCHNHISFYLFFILLIYPFFEVETFTPIGRHGHSSVLVENKIYFFGGTIDVEGGSTNEVFYLDVSQQFNIAFPPFNDVTANEGIPFNSSFGTVSSRDKNNEETIFLFGGYTYNDSITSLVYTLNLKSGKWDNPVIAEKAPEKRAAIQGVIDDFGNIYIFGGGDLSGEGNFPNLLNDMIILNTNDLKWSYGPDFNAPSKRGYYTATLLSNGMIVYIGGQEQTEDNLFREVDMNQINTYDTNSASWSAMVCIY